ncbi:MAG TPA: hypothetical protein DCL61_02235 [Cyanobacteria bacterium UBA12227]|nr:hypothetical protein [Cyanobacteria bacterium UBA12227]HAX85940.1 hypothetical protein [Cyanobacteria bacterium UBA11370]HBY79966.1 hypothetical protein [Cyanobacteria bacterium UBA11148]
MEIIRKKLVIKLPDELQQQLLEQAQKLNISLELLVVRSLIKLVSQPSPDQADPILPLLGTLTASVSNLAANHDIIQSG